MVIEKQLDFSNPHFKLSEFENLKFKPLNPTNSFIEKLYNHYYTEEFLENYFDSEPEIKDEKLKQNHMIYDLGYNKNSWTEAETIKYKAAYDEVERIKKEFSEHEKLEKLCWCEVYGEGIWHMSQKKVDEVSYKRLRWVKRNTVSYKDRIYYAKTENRILIYYYGRDRDDIANCDFWWTFYRKE